VKSAIPERFAALFWDVDVSALDTTQHRPFILDRILEYGGIEAVRWAERRYGLESIKAYFQRRGYKTLSVKTRSYWACVFGLTDQKYSKPYNSLWPY